MSRQGPDGQNQWDNSYSSWNSNQTVLNTDWGQAHSQQYPSTVPSQTSWGHPPLVNSNSSSNLGSFLNHGDCPPQINTEETMAQSVSHVDSQLTSSTTLTLLSTNSESPLQQSTVGVLHGDVTDTLISDTVSSEIAHPQNKPDLDEAGNGESGLSNFFQHDDCDVPSRINEDEELTEKKKSEKGLSNEGRQEQERGLQSEIESLGPGGIYGRAPYLRCDSWISNSSLLTYNRSTAGSQEFLSGSFYGDEGPVSMSSITGVCHSFDDMRLSSPQSLPYQLQQHHHHQHLLPHHPLHQSLPPNPTQGSHVKTRRRSSVEEQVTSLPLDASNVIDLNAVSKETRRSSLPNVNVLSNQEVDSKNKEMIKENSESVKVTTVETDVEGRDMAVAQPSSDVSWFIKKIVVHYNVPY